MKVKEWIKEHKGEIAMTGLTIGTAVICYTICKNTKKAMNPNLVKNAPNVYVDHTYDGIDKASKELVKAVDKDIFTILAPMIEDAVLTEGVDECVFDTTYTVPFPKNGDWKNGTYNVLKNVQVIIKDAGDAVKEAK